MTATVSDTCYPSSVVAPLCAPSSLNLAKRPPVLRKAATHTPPSQRAAGRPVLGAGSSACLDPADRDCSTTPQAALVWARAASAVLDSVLALRQPQNLPAAGR